MHLFSVYPNNISITMIKILLILSSTMAFSICCNAQKTLDNAYLRCTYDFVYLKDTLSNKKTDKDILYLQIGQEYSKCFSYYSYQVDSLQETPRYESTFWTIFKNAMDKEGSTSSNYPHKRMKTYVYKNYPKGKITVTDGLSLQDYVYEDDLNAQDWQIQDSIKNILGYPCQKAKCNFRGRQWTVWFASDIPVSDGPWKLGGLPGLIMEAFDKGMQYHFTIIGLQKVEGEPIVFSNTHVGSNRFEKTSRKDFLKAQKRYLMDMNGYIELETGIDLASNTSQKIMRYDLLEVDYK
jgi:GLPGLI family protein